MKQARSLLTALLVAAMAVLHVGSAQHALSVIGTVIGLA